MKNEFFNVLQSKKNFIGILVFLFCEVAYSLTNYLTTNMQPHLFPFSAIDNAIPFSPLTVWIYFSEIILCITAFTLAKDMRNLARYLISLVTVTVVAIFVFILFPTIYPRIDFPLPNNVDHFTQGLFTWLRHIDYPTNCLPSLHVCYSYLASFVFLQEQRGKFPLFFIWASLIAISTMTTKQHYFHDVLTGLMFVYGLYHLVLFWVPQLNETLVTE